MTQFRFYSPMWHRSDMAHDHVSRKKSHGFRYSQIGFRPHSYVEINPIWIGYVHLRLPCKWLDRILPCKCDSYIIEMCVFVTFRGTDIPVTWNISSWVAEYTFFPFVLNKRRSDAEMYCIWNQAECSLLLSVMMAHAQTSASVPFVPLKPQNKMHTNVSLPLIYNHWWTHSVLITKKNWICDMLDNIYHLLFHLLFRVLFHLSFQQSWRHHCPEEFLLGYIIILMYRCNYCVKTFLYEFHVSKLNYVLCTMHTSDMGHF